ncbi:hypothetical protein ACHAWF_001481 [Thalassiosira exigua]
MTNGEARAGGTTTNAKATALAISTPAAGAKLASAFPAPKPSPAAPVTDAAGPVREGDHRRNPNANATAPTGAEPP